MANDVYTSILDFQSCATRGTPRRHEKKLQLFPPSGPFELIAMDILSPLPKTSSGN